jgi:peptidoglycan/LPS O-acetylase OafA/YrhL
MFFNPIPSKGRIPSLDGWRALAIILVLGDHAVYATGFPQEGWDWIGKIFHGDLGVRIFFVLSGFLISLLLLREVARTGCLSLKDFYLRRIFRIFPVYFTYLGVIAVFVIVGLYAESTSSWVGSLTFTRNMVGQGESATVHLWSLAVEEQFYLAWPVAFAALKLWKRPTVYLGLLLIPMIICPVLRANGVADPGGNLLNRVFGARSIVMYADSLAVGCFGAWMIWKTPDTNVGGWRRHHTGLLFGCIALIIAGRVIQLSVGEEWVRLSNALVPSIQAWAILVCLWLSASRDAPIYRFLNSQPMVTMGMLSYSIYIWHFLFLGHFVGAGMEFWPTHDWRVWIFPSLAVAAASYYFLEMPILRWRRSFRSQ